jgi:hypothetical protein
MADNTTTYKAVIETEVKGQKSVEEMNKTIEEGGEKFKSLRSQIRETTVKLQELADKGKEGTKEFKELSNQLDDLGDKQKKVAFQSGQIEDKLSALPGPIGSIGKGFASAKEAVDTFGVNLAIATGGITLIIGAIIAMKEAMGKTKEGNDALNKVTDALGKIMAPIFALLEKVAIPIFLKFAEVLEWVAGKVTKFVEWLGISKGKINEIATEGNKAFWEQAEKDAEHAKLVYDTYKAIDDKNKADALERKRKYLEKQEELQKIADEKEKKDLEKQLALIESVRKRFSKGEFDVIGSDGLTAAQREKALKEEAARKEYYQKKTDELTKKMQPQMQAWMLANTRSSLEKEFRLKQAAVKKESAVDAWLSSEKKKKLDQNLMATKAALNIAGNLVDEGSAAAKAIAIAQTGIDTYQSATAAYKAVVGIPVVGPFLAPVAAAAAIAAGLMSVKKILSTEIPKMGDGSGGAGGASASGGVPTIEAPTVAGFSAPDVNIGNGQNPTSQIAGTLAAASGKPVKAYVVSTDMSSQQALDRRTSRAATLSGGY